MADVIQLRIATARSSEKIGLALEVLLRKHGAGRLHSLMFIAEEIGNPKPMYAIAGRFRDDPTKAIGHLAIMKEKVTEYAADLAPDIKED